MNTEKSLIKYYQTVFSNIYVKKLMYDQVELASRTQNWFNNQKPINVTHHLNWLKQNKHVILSIEAEKVTKFNTQS